VLCSRGGVCWESLVAVATSIIALACALLRVGNTLRRPAFPSPIISFGRVPVRSINHNVDKRPPRSPRPLELSAGPRPLTRPCTPLSSPIVAASTPRNAPRWNPPAASLPPGWVRGVGRVRGRTHKRSRRAAAAASISLTLRATPISPATVSRPRLLPYASTGSRFITIRRPVATSGTAFPVCSVLWVARRVATPIIRTAAARLLRRDRHAYAAAATARTAGRHPRVDARPCSTGANRTSPIRDDPAASTGGCR
jgi:hypothetical protein